MRVTHIFKNDSRIIVAQFPNHPTRGLHIVLCQSSTEKVTTTALYTQTVTLVQ